jgi:hypothetical protein
MERFVACSLLLLGVACASSAADLDAHDGLEPLEASAGTAELVDHTGATVTIRSGFVSSYLDQGEERWSLVLGNMDDSCASLTWWAQRDQQLTQMFFDDDPDFEGALQHTVDDFEAQMSTERPWFVEIDLVAQGDGMVTVPGARDEGFRDDVFFAYAVAMEPPTYEEEVDADGSVLRTFGATRYEAKSWGGELRIRLDDEGARGEVATGFELGEVDGFELSLPFDVPVCDAYLEAYGLR